ncbi:small G protein signaling modulator 1 isoform X1 [Epinephelus lanceolatus]|uniref:small G protein signaling modulator 1-like isoform X1 n=1 Tax=Epinephelus lanceolatus TaxID=310571 RepID=UPI0014477737|nr:small G protein signaling modulator 1-like isoform X1 [Epinephelus lanceolatus]XP_033503523.1 small G protein signaling modulator 1 isoform X1 [Epinephelus lanceolatus]
MFSPVTEAETRQKLLRNVKKEVKQIMEEAVTRKFVHADSSHIISFCAVVEACMLHGLKRRIAGLLCSNKVAALFMKAAKTFSPAEELCNKVQELEQLIDNSKQNNSSLSNDRSRQSKLANLPPQALKHLWIRTALMEKLLDKIVLYLVENSSAFYEKEAMLMDPVDGPILASLLVGPCALEYTKVKTADHFWTDPSADELVQRHRIHSSHCRQDSPSRRPALIQKRQSSGSMDDRPLMWVRDYVESLHQNSRATLLFGKNNVLVQPRDDMEAIPGYLSLHQTADLMTLKWTPNQLMNGNVGELDSEKSVYWDYAMTIRLEEIVYLHCHQQVNSGGTVVLVSQDGIQRPPLHFPKGGHLLQFLTCLETGLLPHGQLDPPLWNQRGKGKVFPKLRKRSPHGSCDSVSDKEDDEATDYVFRILFPGNQMEFMALELMDQGVNMWQPTPRKSSCSSCSQNGSSDGSLPNGCNQERAPLKLLCDTMKYQIISRAFYGWLAYCRHLSTVRTHLSALVNTTIVDPDVPCNARGGLSVEVWSRFLKDSSAYEEEEIHRLVYFGGVDPSLRKEVWPFLLGHYGFNMTEKCRQEIDEKIRNMYEQTMKDWQGCEAIVRQREREKHAEALARCSSGASVERGPVQRDSTISTDSSLSSSSDPQNVASQSDSSSSSAQVFGSVEAVDQIETEPRAEEGEVQPSSPLKDITSGTADAPQLPSCSPFSPDLSDQRTVSENSLLVTDSAVGSATNEQSEEASEILHEKDKTGSKPEGEDVMDPVAKDEVSETKVETVSEGEVVKDCGVSESRQTSESEEKPDAKEKDTANKQPADLKAVDTNTNLRSAPESTNVLKLEREIHNEYFQAPPLGQILTFQAHKSKGPEVEPLCPPAAEKDTNPESEKKSEISDKPETTSEKTPSQIPKACTTESERKDAEAAVCDLAETKKAAEIPFEKPGSNSPVRQVLNALQSASRGSLSLSSHSRQSPDTADSDDSPSALEMEDIPAGTCVTSEDIKARPLACLAAPPVSLAQRQKMASEDLAPDHHLDTACNTSPEGTDLGLSEEEPEMENVLTEPESAEVGGTKHDESSEEQTYSQETLDMYLINLHRIDKDVRRCDRAYWYFTPENLEKLRNIMCSYVWQHLDTGYVQGMCDLLAPLLVILDDEVMAFSCFTELMKRMNQNFPHGGAMDSHFANMRSLIQILDSELFELMQQNGDYTHFYFCYRWFLLDFKREMVYDDVFSVWETIWAAKYTSSEHFVLFIALALVEMYRDIILENNMDFTDIIKFFNEMAERHNVPQVLMMARDLVNKVQTLIENK